MNGSYTIGKDSYSQGVRQCRSKGLSSSKMVISSHTTCEQSIAHQDEGTPWWIRTCLDGEVKIVPGTGLSTFSSNSSCPSGPILRGSSKLLRAAAALAESTNKMFRSDKSERSTIDPSLRSIAKPTEN